MGQQHDENAYFPCWQQNQYKWHPPPNTHIDTHTHTQSPTMFPVEIESVCYMFTLQYDAFQSWCKGNGFWRTQNRLDTAGWRWPSLSGSFAPLLIGKIPKQSRSVHRVLPAEGSSRHKVVALEVLSCRENVDNHHYPSKCCRHETFLS